MSIEWTPRQPTGSLALTKLGTIEIYQDKDGMCVDINGRRAWSAWRDTLEGIQLSISGSLYNWEYLNSFML